MGAAGQRQRGYSAEQKRVALAELLVRGGNVSATAEALGIPRVTLLNWRDQAERAGEAMPPPPVSAPVDYAALWGEAHQCAVARLLVMIDQAQTAREAAYVAGLTADKLLDFTQGRRGHTINVDARQLAIGANLSDAERRELLLMAATATEEARPGGQGA